MDQVSPDLCNALALLFNSDVKNEVVFARQ